MSTRMRTGLFVYGAVVDLLLFRSMVHYWYKPPADTTVVNNLLVNSFVLLVGGASLGLAMLRFFRTRSGGSPLRTAPTLAKAGAYGAIATVLAFEILLLACAVGIAVTSVYREGGGPSIFALTLGLGLLSLHVYLFLAYLYLIPFGFLIGTIPAILELMVQTGPTNGPTTASEIGGNRI